MADHDVKEPKLVLGLVTSAQWALNKIINM